MDAEEQVASTRELRAELIELRASTGISALRVREYAPKIMALPATTFELGRRGLHQSDRHVAAQLVIECAVFAMRRSDWSAIATRTLNIQGKHGNSLTERRRHLRIEMCLSEKQYARLEEETYIELAGLVAACKPSPCLDTETRPPLTTGQLLELIGQSELVVTRLDAMLTVLRLVGSVPVDIGSRALLVSGGFPRADAFIEARTDAIAVDGRDKYTSFMIRAINYIFPTEMMIVDLDLEKDGQKGLVFDRQMFTMMYLASHPGTQTGTYLWYEPHTWCYDFADNEQLAPLSRFVRDDFTVEDDYFAVKANSLTRLVWMMFAIESENNWPAIIEGNLALT